VATSHRIVFIAEGSQYSEVFRLLLRTHVLCALPRQRIGPRQGSPLGIQIPLSARGIAWVLALHGRPQRGRPGSWGPLQPSKRSNFITPRSHFAWRHSGVGGDPLGTSATVEPRLGLGSGRFLPPHPWGRRRRPHLRLHPVAVTGCPVALVWVLAHAIASKTPAFGGVNDQSGFWRSDAEGRT
jgi:hypothetical protein